MADRYNPLDDLSPYELIRLRQELGVRARTSPDQAARNRRQTAEEVLSIIPGPGNVIAARDAYQSGRQAIDDFGAGRVRQGALNTAMAGLSGFGALAGLPTSRMAGRVAKDAPRTLYSGAGPSDLPMDEPSRMARAKAMGYSDERFYRGEAKGDLPDQYEGATFFSRDDDYARGFANRGGQADPREFRLKTENAFRDYDPMTAAQYARLVEAAAANDPKLARELAEQIAPGKSPEWVIGFGRARPDFIVVESGGASLVRQAIERNSSDAVDLFRRAGFQAIDSGRDVRMLGGEGIRQSTARFDPTKASSRNLLAGMAGASLLPAAFLGDDGQ